MQHFDAKSAQNLHILQKIKKIDSEKSPNLHILKKNQKIKNQVIYASESHIESEIFDFFVFLSICRFGDFSLSKLLIFLSICRFFCTFGINMLIFLSICRLGEPQVPQTCIYSKKSNILIGKNHQTCIY